MAVKRKITKYDYVIPSHMLSAIINRDYSRKEDITFFIPENMAQEIKDRFHVEEYQFSCLSGDFVDKLWVFLEEVI